MAKRRATIARRRAIFEEAIAFVESEYARDLNLDLVAQQVSTSRRHLQRCFSEIGGTNFSSHLTEVRMRHALQLLRCGRRSVRAVALSVGYRHQTSFAKAFHRRFGAPPREVEGE